jgi:hypothetical protein
LFQSVFALAALGYAGQASLISLRWLRQAKLEERSLVRKGQELRM